MSCLWSLGRSERGRWPSVSNWFERRLKTFAIDVIHRKGIEPKYGDALAPKSCSWNLWERLPAGSGSARVYSIVTVSAIEPIFNAHDASFSWDGAPHGSNMMGDPQALREDSQGTEVASACVMSNTPAVWRKKSTPVEDRGDLHLTLAQSVEHPIFADENLARLRRLVLKLGNLAPRGGKSAEARDAPDKSLTERFCPGR